jgi:chaperonin GroEL (HSP60 family)
VFDDATRRKCTKASTELAKAVKTAFGPAPAAT